MIVCTYLAENNFDGAAGIAGQYLKIMDTDKNIDLRHRSMVAVLGYFAMIANKNAKGADDFLSQMTAGDEKGYIAPIKEFLLDRIDADTLVVKFPEKDKILPHVLAGLRYYFSEDKERALLHLKWVDENGSLSWYLYELAMAGFHELTGQRVSLGPVKSISMLPDPAAPGTKAEMRAVFNPSASSKKVTLEWYIFQNGAKLLGPISKTMTITPDTRETSTPFIIPTMATSGTYDLRLKVKEGGRVLEVSEGFTIK
jgi:hypothetical protein